jgi:hypothetical protein
MEQGEVGKKWAGGGRGRLRPKRICAEKDYAKGAIRRYLRRLSVRITIALGGPPSTAVGLSIGRSKVLRVD